MITPSNQEGTDRFRYDVTETIKVNPETNKHAVCKVTETEKFDSVLRKWNFHDRKTEYYHLSRWNLFKEIETFALVRVVRNADMVDLEGLQDVVYYKVKLTYKVKPYPEAETVFLTTSENIRISPNGQRVKYQYIYRSNLVGLTRNGGRVTNVLQLNNPFKDIEVKKGKPEKMSNEEANELLFSGKCCGIFGNGELTKSII